MVTMNGTIKRLVKGKGFGFVASGDDIDYFFHQSACNGVEFDNLREGEAVTFEVGAGCAVDHRRGPSSLPRSSRITRR